MGKNRGVGGRGGSQSPNPQQKRGRPQSRPPKLERIIHAISLGTPEPEAYGSEGWSYIYWKAARKAYPEFAEKLEAAREASKVVKGLKGAEIEDPSWTLEKFRQDVFGHETFEHQRQWDAWASDPEAQHILIVTFPEASKTTFWRQRLVYRLAKNPDLRCAYATYAHDKAVKQVDWMRRVFMENKVLKRIRPGLMPEGDVSRPWSAAYFTLGLRSFDVGAAEADYSMVGFGVKTQAAGSRIDEFIVDDIDGKRGLSPAERRQAFEKIVTEFETRLGRTGRMVVCCNRWDIQDVAGIITEQAQQNPGLWKVFFQPAVLRAPDLDDPEDWGEVSWPQKFGLPMDWPESAPITHDGPWTDKQAWGFFRRKKLILGDTLFNLLYMNDATGGADQEFPPQDIALAEERGKDFRWGEVPPGSVVVCAQDPAGDTGGAATLAIAILPTGEHLVVDVDWGRNVGHPGLIKWVGEFGKYRPAWWAIESQGGFSLYTKDKNLTDLIWEQRAQLAPLHTNQNKNAEGVGVTSLGQLIREKLILPSQRPEDSERMAPLKQQLLAYRRPTWDGDKWQKPQGAFDCVMALWFAERVIRDKDLAPSEEILRRMAWSSPYSDWSRGSWALK